MKRFFVTTAALALSVTTAHAADIVTSGYWTAYVVTEKESSTGVVKCGLKAALINRSSGKKAEVHIKFRKSDDEFFIQLFRDDWNFREAWNFGGNRIPLETAFSFDGHPVTITSMGFTEKVGDKMSSFVESHVKYEFMPRFLKLFITSKQLTIEFPDGNEPQWDLSLSGAGKATDAFMKCINSIGGIKHTGSDANATPTKPFGGKKQDDGTIATPFPAPTKPFGAKKKDDGSI